MAKYWTIGQILKNWSHCWSAAAHLILTFPVWRNGHHFNVDDWSHQIVFHFRLELAEIKMISKLVNELHWHFYGPGSDLILVQHKTWTRSYPGSRLTVWLMLLSTYIWIVSCGKDEKKQKETRICRFLKWPSLLNLAWIGIA